MSYFFHRFHEMNSGSPVFSKSMYSPLRLAQKQSFNHPAVLHLVAQLTSDSSLSWSRVENLMLLWYFRQSPTITLVWIIKWSHSIDRTINMNGINICIHTCIYHIEMLFNKHSSLTLWMVWENTLNTESNHYLSLSSLWQPFLLNIYYIFTWTFIV